MAGNSFGDLFRITTFGESHGQGVGVVIDGCPAGFQLDLGQVQNELERRRPGRTFYTSQRQEADKVEVLSGLFRGMTTGAPLTLWLANQDPKSSHYAQLEDKYRPGHADYTYQAKYGIRDHRGGGRASARETAVRVAAGAVAKQYLYHLSAITVRGCLTQLGPIAAQTKDWEQVSANDFFWPDADTVDQLAGQINELRRSGDSLGAAVTVEAHTIPPGLGEPVYDKLDADLAKAMISINAVKAVSIGDGWDVVTQKGSFHQDAMTPEGFESNHSGGTLGGISSGQTLQVHLAVKPTSSIAIEQTTITREGEPATVSTHGRHDPCIGIRAVPVAEAMMALVLMDHWLRQRAQSASNN